MDVEGLLRRSGVTVYRWFFADDISGVFLREPKAIIAVNAAHYTNRQRFTMAHEFYHYLYHQSLSNLMCMTNLTDTSRYEHEASRFAAALLMPEETVRTVVRRCDLESAAETIMVSTEALRRRLRELGIMEGMIA